MIGTLGGVPGSFELVTGVVVSVVTEALIIGGAGERDAER